MVDGITDSMDMSLGADLLFAAVSSSTLITSCKSYLLSFSGSAQGAGARTGSCSAALPSRLPLPPKRSGAGPDPPAQEGCRADSSSPRLLAAGCGPTAAGRRRTKLRAESGAAPPPFRPNAGGLLAGSTASRDREPGLRCSQPRGAGPRAAAAPRGRSGESRGKNRGEYTIH